MAAARCGRQKGIPAGNDRHSLGKRVTSVFAASTALHAGAPSWTHSYTADTGSTHLGKRVTSVYVSSTVCRRATAASCWWSRSSRSTCKGRETAIREKHSLKGGCCVCCAPLQPLHVQRKQGSVPRLGQR